MDQMSCRALRFESKADADELCNPKFRFVWIPRYKVRLFVVLLLLFIPPLEIPFHQNHINKKP
jgi:hypothetical protein